MSRYTPTTNDEGCLNADVIAKELLELGRPRMARFVRDLGTGVQRANQRASRFEKRCIELEEMLPQFKREERYDPTPPPEASD